MLYKCHCGRLCYLGDLSVFEKITRKKGKLHGLISSYRSHPPNFHTEGYIEGAMRNLKQEDFTGRKHLRVDTFVSEKYTRIRSRLHDYGDRLHTRLISKTKRTYKRKTKKANDVDNPYARIVSSSSSE